MQQRRFLHLSALASTLLGAVLVCASAHALPPAGAYPSKTIALDQPSADESRALETLQMARRKAGLPLLVWDGSLSAVAREHSQEMAAVGRCQYYFDRLGSLDYRLQRAGVAVANARYAVFRTDSLATLEEQFQGGAFAKADATHVGVGVISSGVANRDYFITFISREQRVFLEPFPTLPLYGRSYALRGTLSPGFNNLELFVTLPDGSVQDAPLKPDINRNFSSNIRFDQGAGKYTVELVADGKLGPVVLVLMHCYAGNGKDYPAPDGSDRPVQTPSDLRQAERILLDMINKSRAEAGLAPLRADDRLAVVARGHSDDMRRNNYFAHVSPTQGDLSTRVARAGIKARRFTENIAANQDLAAAHRGLMDSPGHRKNIMDPDVTAAGIGIVMGDQQDLFITENFIADFINYDTDKLAQDLLRLINAARAKDKLPVLKTNDKLRQIALHNSAWMVEAGKAGYDKAKTELERTPQNLKTIQMAAFQSADPPQPDALGKLLKEKDYQQVGIGIRQSSLPTGEKFLYTTVLLGQQ